MKKLATPSVSDDLIGDMLSKFGSVKYVCPPGLVREMRSELTALLRERLPAARVLYWT